MRKEPSFGVLAASANEAASGQKKVGEYPRGNVRRSSIENSWVHKLATVAVRLGGLGFVLVGGGMLVDNVAHAGSGGKTGDLMGDFCYTPDLKLHHHTNPGENLWQIAAAHGISVENLATTNNIVDISNHRLYPGQDLLLPINCLDNQGIYHPMIAIDSKFSIMDPVLTPQERVDDAKALSARINSGYYKAETYVRNSDGSYDRIKIIKFETISKTNDNRVLATVQTEKGDQRVLPIETVWIAKNESYKTGIQAKLPEGVTDDQIFSLINSPQAIKGANAVVHRVEGIPDMTPVRIIGPKFATDFSLPATLIVIANVGGQERVVEVQDSQSILISNYLKSSWLSANSPVPEDSVLRDTLIKANLGIDEVNRIYLHYNIPIRLIHYDQYGAEFPPITDSGSWNDNGKIKLAIGLITDPVRLSDGFVRMDENGQILIDHSYQSPVNSLREIYRAVHERIHDGQQQFEKVNHRPEWYNKDVLLTSAYETYANWMTNQAIQAYANDAELKPFVNNLTDTQAKNWGNLLIRKFNSAGLDGQFVLINYGSVGDVIGLKTFYEQQFGKGTFNSTLDSETLR